MNATDLMRQRGSLRTMTVIGRVSKGGEKSPNAPGRDLQDKFRVSFNEQWQHLETLWNEVMGDETKQLTVVVDGANTNEAVRVNKEQVGERERVTTIIYFAVPEFNQHPDVPDFARFVLSTTSTYDFDRIVSPIHLVYQAQGTLEGIPFFLSRECVKKMDNRGSRRDFWLLKLEPVDKSLLLGTGATIEAKPDNDKAWITFTEIKVVDNGDKYTAWVTDGENMGYCHDNNWGLFIGVEIPTHGWDNAKPNAPYTVSLDDAWYAICEKDSNDHLEIKEVTNIPF